MFDIYNKQKNPIRCYQNSLFLVVQPTTPQQTKYTNTRDRNKIRTRHHIRNRNRIRNRNQIRDRNQIHYQICDLLPWSCAERESQLSCAERECNLVLKNHIQNLQPPTPQHRTTTHTHPPSLVSTPPGSNSSAFFASCCCKKSIQISNGHTSLLSMHPHKKQHKCISIFSSITIRTNI